jgi:hypothetical protein
MTPHARKSGSSSHVMRRCAAARTQHLEEDQAMPHVGAGEQRQQLQSGDVSENGEDCAGYRSVGERGGGRGRKGEEGGGRGRKGEEGGERGRKGEKEGVLLRGRCGR